MICVLVENGRLGNQLFQYNALRSFYPKSFCLAFGFDSLRSLLRSSDDNIYFISTRTKSSLFLQKIACYMLRRYLLGIVIFLCRVRLFSSVVSSPDTSTVSHHKLSIIPAINVFLGYFQYASLHLSPLSNTCNLLPILSGACEDFKHCFPSQKDDVVHPSLDTNYFFIHIRRGDYTWFPYDYPAVLPLAWFKKCMNLVRQNVDSPKFYIFSDDYYYALDFASLFPDCVCAHGDEVSDFLALTNCLGGGIMSSSTYAWWASFVVLSRNPDALFYAPNFWMGHRMAEWFPNSGLIAPWLNFISVDYCE